MICWLLLLGTPWPLVVDQSLHAIVITDLSSEPAQRDWAIIGQEFSQICKRVGLTFRPQYFHSNEPGLNLALKKLRCQPDDVLLFYFSGHASNWDGWPSFANQGDQIRYQQTKVYEVLRAKAARLTLVWFDGCNIGRYQRTEYKFKKVYKIGLYDHLKFLFRKSRGIVLACASRTGNFAYGNEDSGSFFTVSLMEAIRGVPVRQIGDRRQVWKRWSQLVTQQTNYLCQQVQITKQYPKFYLAVTTDPND